MTEKQAKAINNEFEVIISKLEKVADLGDMECAIIIKRDVDGELIVSSQLQDGKETMELHNIHPFIGMFAKPISLTDFLIEKLNETNI